MKKKYFFIVSILLVVVLVFGCAKVQEILEEAGISLPAGKTVDDYLKTATATATSGIISGSFSMMDEATFESIYPTKGNFKQVTIGGSGVATCTVTINVTKGSSTSGTIACDSVIVLDQSGSMGWNDPTTLRATAAKNYVEGMLSPTASYYVSGSKVGLNNFDTTQFNAASMDVQLTTSLSALRTEIDKSGDYGGTPVWTATDTAIDDLAANGTQSKRFVLTLTDGESNSETAGITTASITSLANANNIVLHMLYLLGPNNTDQTGTPDMKAVAAATGGIFKVLTTANISTFYTSFVQSTTTAGTFTIDASGCNFTAGNTYTVHCVLIFDGNETSFDFTVTF